MSTDVWGQPVAGAGASVAAWDRAWEQFLHFRGDPTAVLTPANETDETFVAGSVFCATYAVLAGSRFDAPNLLTHVRRARSRVASAPDREASHVEALEHLVAGDFSRAAQRWEQLARSERDFAAIRYAHDVYLHIGDADRRLTSSRAAVAEWGDARGANFIAGQYSFALEEVGRYDEAEEIGLGALDADADDLWARHALAHVYESTENNEAAFKLLVDSAERWNEQDLLATHIWWHLALRLLAVGDIAAVLTIFDERLPQATTAFRLSDQSSLLWRAELAGFDVGDRWDALADRWDAVAERHSNGFLDVHAALTFARCPEHPGGRRWFDGLADRRSGTAENDEIFSEVVVALVAAFRSYAAGEPDRFASIVDGLGPTTSRIGGSIAQRDLISLTRRAAGAPA